MKKILRFICLLASVLAIPTVTMAVTKEQCMTLYSNGVYLTIMEHKCNYDQNAGKENLAIFQSNKCAELLTEKEATSNDRTINSEANGWYALKGKNSFCTENSKAISMRKGISAIEWVNLNKVTNSNSNSSADRSSSLKCGKNVDCNSYDNALDKMINAYSTIRGAKGKGNSIDEIQIDHYLKICSTAINNIKSMQRSMRAQPGVIDPQLQICNEGLFHLERKAK